MADLGLSGLATGMDTTTIIEQLVQHERMPIYRYQEEISSIGKVKDVWRDINTRLNHLEGTLSNLESNTTFDSRTTSSSDKEIATAIADNSATEGSYDLVINQTASSQRIAGSRVSDVNSDLNTLSGLAGVPAESSLLINGEEVIIKDTDSLSDMVDKINDSDSGVKATIVDNHLVLESEQTGVGNEIGLVDDNDLLENLGVISSGDNDKQLQTNQIKVTDADTALGFTGSFQLKVLNSDGTTASTADVTVDDTTSLNQLKTEIDGLTNMSATVIDDGNGYYSLQINSSITDSSIKLSNTGTDTNLLNDLSFGNRAYANQLQLANDASIDVNGISNITSPSNSFSETVDGVTFNINSDAATGDSVTVDVNKDSEKTVSTVQSFVEQYNSLISFIDNKTEYDSESDEGAILQGDSTAKRLQVRIREQVMNKINSNGQYTHLSEVGISIDRYGKMSLDSSKLKESLDDAPEDVQKLFNAEESEDGFSGMATRLNNYVDLILKTNTGLIPRRLQSYDKEIRSLNDDIDDVERRVKMVRERYQQQFTAMEQAISQMQEQQSWMTSQLSSLGSSNNMLSSL